METLLRAFPLNSDPGVALLSLAEALLRVPDTANATRLLRDRLSRVDWHPQSGGAGLRWLLGCAGRLIRESNPWAKLAAPPVRLGARLAIQGLAGQFVFAETIEAALRRSFRERSPGYRYSFDMLGEAATNDEDAQRYLAAYCQAIHAVGGANGGRGPIEGGSISIKLSAIHPRYSYAQHGSVIRELLPRLQMVARLARRYDIALTIDAEESERLEPSLDLIECLLDDAELNEWSGLGVAVQAYQKRAPAVIDHLLHLTARRPGRLQLRLVKGAYWDAEIKLAQMEGLSDFPVYTRKVYTDVAYLACARRLLQATERVLPQFATHNAHTVASILELADGAPADAFEFQCLYGMGGGLYDALIRRPDIMRPVRIYAPVGARPLLLAYLMRRLLENGAAASFVQRAADSNAEIEPLLADPALRAKALAGVPHPRIAAPAQIFEPLRRNSAGIDLSDPAELAVLREALARSRAQPLTVTPLLAAAGSADTSETTERPATLRSPPLARSCEIRNPADRRELIGWVREADENDLREALQAATHAGLLWAQRGAQARLQILRQAANLFEQHRPELVALAMRESGKTLANAVGEVREAVDYLRYYPACIRPTEEHANQIPLGVVACISPWNFPLAIFTGQIAAALTTGNAVIAKPAEQSNALAMRAVQLLHQAGVPRGALQLLPGEGGRIGARLVSDPRVGGVLFTGSSAVARTIARALAARGNVPLIAETGGQNAMIVDSTALPEQVVADALRSAFDSAGQRCSALRLLCLQQEIAQPVLAMLEGAMRELRVGDPADIATDVGPLIDEAARERIETHLRGMQAQIRCRSPLNEACRHGVFVAPALIEIHSVAELTQEVFGPVLHVLRFERAALPALLADIQATGYGLTLGIASRVEETIGDIVRQVRVGNVYVNRNMIGAVVGLQPFGGQGLSGTGPKAGGPFYLQRLLRRPPSIDAGDQASGPPPLLQLIEWTSAVNDQAGTIEAVLSDEQRCELRAQAQAYARHPVLDACLSLTGYVGERNELRLHSRGVLRATARSLPALAGQLAAALATGNALQADESRLASQLRATLPPMLRIALLEEMSTLLPYEAVLVDAADASTDPAWLQQLYCEEAAKQGPIVPVVVSDDGYALELLLREQTVTVNTAAVGGDVRLLALDDS
jgi:RHH-type proline utilization regulon transcriptional repressor/proline dehydrogenase/delta 1-pyrroline-5-carboxylate dehydrogenase